VRTSLDEYAHLDSPLHSWEPRLKLLSLGALASTFAAVRDPRLLPMMLAASLALCLFARLLNHSSTPSKSTYVSLAT
jgi:cobalt/nickel transport system permease protein